MEEYHDAGYAKFKADCGEAVVEKLRPVREEYLRLMDDKKYLADVAAKGAERARRIAARTMTKVKKKIGLVLA